MVIHTTRRTVRLCIVYAAAALFIAAMFSDAKTTSSSKTSGASGVPAPTTLSPQEKLARSEHRKQTKRVYSLVEHIVRICVYAFLSSVFAGLTLGVMCADTFTLEIIAESGPAPDCTYAAKVLPLRKQGHQTLCTLIITNMLCNVLIVQEFSTFFDIVHAIRTNGNAENVVDDSGSRIWSFIVSTAVIVVVTELIPMSICKSQYSLRVAAAGSIFVKVAMFITYPISVPLGKLLDWLVGGEETGQIYDRNELRKLMVVHYEREEPDNTMPKTELNLLLAAMDFQERRVRDIMTPISDVTYVNENDKITPDFVERLWLSGRSRVPVQGLPGHFTNILVVKDLMTVNMNSDQEETTVAQVVNARNRLFAMVSETTTLPSMLKFFQDASTHMAVVFAEDAMDKDVDMTGGEADLTTSLTGMADPTRTLVVSPTPPTPSAVSSAQQSTSKSTIAGGKAASRDARGGRGAEDASLSAADAALDATTRRSFAKTITMAASRTVVGIVTMEDVVEELLNDEIYDEYDRYDPVDDHPSASASPTIKSAGVTSQFARLTIPPEPKKQPRVNFYSYFTHPEANIPLTDAQVWAAAYYLQRTVHCFVLWPVGCVKLLLDECRDEQLIAPPPAPLLLSPNSTTGSTGGGGGSHDFGALPPLPPPSASTASGTATARPSLVSATTSGGAAVGENTSNSTAGAEPSERRMSSFTRGPSPIAVDHVNFLNSAAEERFILYSKGMPTECFTLVLGGQVDLLVGRDSFPSKLLSFNFIAEEALTSPFYVPEFSAIVRTAARVYRIPKEKYEKYVTFQSVAKNVGTRVRILSSNTTLQQQRGSPRAALTNSFQRKHRGHSSDRESPTGSPLTRGTSETAMANERDQLLSRGSAFADRQSERALPRQPTAPASATRGKGYGTFSQKSAH